MAAKINSLNRGRSRPGGLVVEQGRKTKNHILVARGADMVVVRVVGAGNMITAPVLHDFVEFEYKAGYRRFVFDLSLCRGLDSTFMGCMVGLSNKVLAGSDDGWKPVEDNEAEEMSPEEALKELQEIFDSGGASVPDENEFGSADQFVIAVNVSAECKELMNILGVDNFVKIRGDVGLSQLEMAVLAEKEIPVAERRQLILDAHENLVEIDQRNEAKFGAFLRSLSEELAK